MKADPINIVLNKNFNFNKKFYFITGNEITLMDGVKDIITNHYVNTLLFGREIIKDITMAQKNVGLFNNNKIQFVESLSKVSNDELDKMSNESDVFIFKAESDQKSRLIKSIFLKRNDSCLIECYELTRDQKGVIFNEIIDTSKLKIETNSYWGFIDTADNRYGLFKQELNKLNEFSKEVLKDRFNEIVEKLVSKNSNNVDRVFFNINKSNSDIIKIYNQKIVGVGEFNEFFYNSKQFCLLIINSFEEEAFSKSIPRYLFREKKMLIGIFKKYSPRKKKLLLKLLNDTEKVVRKNSSLSVVMGLRFLLNLRRITIS